VARALGNRCDEKLGACDQLVARRVMLADPCFIIAELVHPLDEFDVAFKCEGRIFIQRVKRCNEGTEPHLCSCHGDASCLTCPVWLVLFSRRGGFSPASSPSLLLQPDA